MRITFYNGDSVDYTCRYIDEYHVEVGSNLYHICQFAEIMQRNGNKVIPLRASLPETCYSTLANTGEIVIIKRGESGYYPTDIPAKDIAEAKEIVDEMNEKGGVSKAQAEAMKVGSMFGWAVRRRNIFLPMSRRFCSPISSRRPIRFRRSCATVQDSGRACI